MRYNLGQGMLLRVAPRKILGTACLILCLSALVVGRASSVEPQLTTEATAVSLSLSLKISERSQSYTQMLYGALVLLEPAEKSLGASRPNSFVEQADARGFPRQLSTGNGGMVTFSDLPSSVSVGPYRILVSHPICGEMERVVFLGYSDTPILELQLAFPGPCS